MGNTHSSTPKSQHCEVHAEQLDKHSEGSGHVVAAVAVTSESDTPKTTPGVRVADKGVIFSLNVRLLSTEDGTKRERELGLTRIPVTIADLQDQIQEQFNIPVFDQKLTFGPTVLSAKESLQSYSLRNGDNITVEYSSEADVEEILGIVNHVQKTLAFFESVKPQLFLFPISPELDAQLRQNIDVTELDKLATLHISSSPARKIINSQLFINSGGLGHIQRLHSLLLQLPFKETTFSIQVLEIGLNRLLWTLTSSTETEAAVLKELKWENIIQSLFRVTVVPNAAVMPPRNRYTEQHRDVQIEVITELLTATLGCLSW